MARSLESVQLRWVSTMPAAFGEKVVMRLLNRSSALITLGHGEINTPRAAAIGSGAAIRRASLMNFNLNQRPDGGMRFRLPLPAALTAEDYWIFHPCADGQFGNVVKAYADWKISGDTVWLRVVGVVGTVRLQGLADSGEERLGAYYLPFAQAPDPGWHYVIVSLKREVPSVRSWRIVDGAVTEEPVVLVG